MRILLSAALAALLVGTVARPAHAQDTEDAEILRMAKEHYKLGLDAFKAGRYPEAIKELKKAYLLKRLPPLLINIAKTYEKLGDVDNEIYYYKKYLAEAPPDAKDRDQVKQRVDDLVAQKNGAPPPSEATAPAETPQAAPPQQEAEPPPPPRRRPQQQQQAAEPPPEQAPPPAQHEQAPPPSAPPPASMPSEWTHTPIDAVPPGRPVDVRVQTPVMKGVKVWLFYRGKGESDYKQLEMRRHGPEKIARIPGGDVQGKSFQYYIEAKDPSGAIVKSSGSQTDPNIVMIDPGAPVQLASASQAPRGQEPQEETREPPPSEEAPPPAEERPPRKPANPDEEAAPLGPGQQEHGEVPPLGEPAPKKQGGLSPLLLAGIGLAAGGVLVGAVGGGVGFYFAGAYASAVQSDACPGGALNGVNCPGDRPDKRFIFNDPRANPNDSNYQDSGHLADIMGGVSIGVGAALLVAGGALILVDRINHQPKSPKATRHRREAQPSDEGTPPAEAAPPSEPTPPPADDAPPPPQSSIQNFIAVPVVTSHTVGLGAGFSF